MKAALVFWLKSKTSSVLQGQYRKLQEGNIFTLPYTSEKSYLGKIVRVSDDECYLKKLRVNKAGEVIESSKSKGLTAMELTSLKREKSSIKANQIAKKSSINKSLTEQKSIFENDESDLDENEEENVDLHIKKEATKLHLIHSTRVTRSKPLSNETLVKETPPQPPQTKVVNEAELSQKKPKRSSQEKLAFTEQPLRKKRKEASDAKVSHDNESRDKNDLQSSDEEILSETASPQKKKTSLKKRQEEIPSETASPQKKKTPLKKRQVSEDESSERSTDEESDQAALPSHKKRKLIRDKTLLRKESEKSSDAKKLKRRNNDISTSEDPLIETRKPGKSKILLCEDFDEIWIDRMELTTLYRWKKNPKEYARRLLKLLVGKDNLKNMCARGRSDRPGIPQDISDCVEYYVNKKCPDGLAPAAFTTVVNNMCGTLRNPKKS